jgi:hypothetical protein
VLGARHPDTLATQSLYSEISSAKQNVEVAAEIEPGR